MMDRLNVLRVSDEGQNAPTNSSHCSDVKTLDVCVDTTVRRSVRDFKICLRTVEVVSDAKVLNIY